MAVGTYGEPGKNPFTIKGVDGVLSPVVNSTTGVTQIYRLGVLNQYQSLGTINTKTNKFTPDPNANLTNIERKALSDANNVKEIKNKATQAVSIGVQAAGGSPEAAQATANKLVSPNKANTPGGTDATSGNSKPTEGKDQQSDKLLKEALKEVKSRVNYDQSLVYPIGLRLEHQDCIKFSVIKYSASGLELDEASRKERRVVVNSGIPEINKREVLTTITLPIPGGISDSNTVDWSSNSLDEITRGLANVAQSAIAGGGSAGAEAAKSEFENASKNAPDFQIAAASKFTQAALGQNAGILQRQYGAVLNPNMELLFNGPQLRSFGFTFRLSPRSEQEAIVVRKILRYFKQAMSTKRSTAALLLQAPHTFAISYLSSNKQHPYLNKFKECALTSCNVNYTPDGNYMTFGANEPSMTSYELTLQFQELVPLFDDDYGDDNDNVGY
jgi:hypothetical protein